jgi:hypothetical protein
MCNPVTCYHFLDEKDNTRFLYGTCIPMLHTACFIPKVYIPTKLYRNVLILYNGQNILGMHQTKFPCVQQIKQVGSNLPFDDIT